MIHLQKRAGDCGTRKHGFLLLRNTADHEERVEFVPLILTPKKRDTRQSRALVAAAVLLSTLEQ